MSIFRPGLPLRFQVAGYNYAWWGIEQLEIGRSFGSMFLLSLMKVSRGHAHSS